MLEREYITIKNLTIIAKHGVSDWENSIEQEFQFDLKIFSDYAKAAIMDDVEQTVSLTDYYEFLKSFITKHNFRLVEKLATEVARAMLDEYPTIDELQLEVRKNPLPGMYRVDSFCCGFNLKKEIAYLTFACSLGNREKYLNQAIDYLRSIRGINVLKVSNFIEAESDNGAPALNCAVKISTYLEPEEFSNDVLAVEKALCKVEEDCGDECKICDINIMLFGDKKIHTDKLQIPNENLCNKPHVKPLLKNLEPSLEI